MITQINNQSMSNSKTYLILLATILFFAALIRLYGIDFGLPELLHLDEPFEMHRALRLASGDIDLERAGKGGFFYFIFFELALSFLFLFVTGKVSAPVDFAYFFIQNESNFYLGARILNAIFGVATIFFFYKLVTKIYDQRAGIIAALFLSGSTLHVVNSHYATVDVALVFFLTLAWIAIFSFDHQPTVKSALLIGLFSGLALATKLSAALIVPPIVTVVCLGLWDKRFSIKHGAVLLSIMFCTFCLVSIILQPGLIIKLLHLQQTLSRIFWTTANSNSIEELAPHVGYRQSLNLYSLYFGILVENIGIPILTVYLCAFYVLLRHCFRIFILIFPFTILYYITISSVQSDLFYPRYLLPLIPLIFLQSSIGLSFLFNYLSNIMKIRQPITQMTIFFLVFSLCVTPFTNSIKAILKLNKDYSQNSAKHWVEQNITPGASIHMEGNIEHRSQYDVPLLNTDANLSQLINQLEPVAPGKAKYWKLRRKYLTTLERPRYSLSFTNWHDRYPAYEKLESTGIQYIILNTRRMSGGTTAGIVSEQTSSRNAFYQKLIHTQQAVKLKEFNSDDSQNGPPLAIYSLL